MQINTMFHRIKSMRFYSLSITQKLLIAIIPLVCIPIIGVGFFSYNASVNTVTHLLKAEQLLKAKFAATKIDTILHSSQLDLQTMVHWDLISHFPASWITGKETEKTRQSKDIKNLFRNFIARSSYYDFISLYIVDKGEIISVSREGHQWRPASGLLAFTSNIIIKKIESPTVSEIYFSKSRNKYLLHIGLPVKNQSGQFIRVLTIDIDFSKLLESVTSIKVGEKGFAFLVDKLGRTIAHPDYKPYDYDFTKYDDPRLREFTIDMISGETGWKQYNHFGEKVSAFAPVPTVNWSLAVSVPIEEFSREANSLRSIVIHTVVILLIVTVVILGFISYRIVNPIKRLVLATKRVARGDLFQEIPESSSGELALLIRSFNSMTRNLRDTQYELVRTEKLVSMGNLSAGVAHEIRNPLNAMKGAVTYLQKHEGDNPVVVEYSQLILEEIDRLSQFVNEFLHYAKLSTPSLEPTDINGVIENTLNLFSEELQEKGITLHKLLNDNLPEILVDAKQIQQVLINIIVNAIDAVNESGRIEVSSLYQDQKIRFSSQTAIIIKVIDSGSGITEAYLKNIFDPFFSTKEDGTGLGLPISLNIVENHGGAMKISCPEDNGTEVSIILPAEKSQTEIMRTR